MVLSPRIVAAPVVVTALLLGGGAVRAQTKADAVRVEAHRGAELALFGGAAGGGEGGGGSFGWSLAWRPSDRLAIEGTGTWTFEPGIDGFAAMFGPRLYLGGHGRAEPFLALDAGLFHASVDPGAARSTFYLDRMAPLSPEKVFNDFVAAAGGGLDLHIGGRFWIRPDARVLMVVDGWRSHWLGVAGVHLAFEFAGRTPGPRGSLR